MTLNVRTLGLRIARLRELKGLSLGGLSVAAGGIAKSYLAKLEKGGVENPGVRTLVEIANALGITVCDLLSGIEPRAKGDGESLLAEEASIDSTLKKVPVGLKSFLDEMSAKKKPVPVEIIRVLAIFEYRGRRPKDADDWSFLYSAMMRSIR